MEKIKRRERNDGNSRASRNVETKLSTLLEDCKNTVLRGVVSVFYSPPCFTRLCSTLCYAVFINIESACSYVESDVDLSAEDDGEGINPWYKQKYGRRRLLPDRDQRYYTVVPIVSHE